MRVQVKNDKYTVRQLNQMRASEKVELAARENELNDFMNNREFEHIRNDPFMNEETDISQSALASYRTRPDHFKGFNKAQNMYIYKKNEELVSDHKIMKQAERDDEKAWANHTSQVVRMMEQSEQQNRDHKQYIERLQDDDIQAQRKVQAMKKQLSEEDRFGKVSSGFFDGFGTSCR